MQVLTTTPPRLDVAEARALNARLTRSLEFAEAATTASPAEGDQQRCAPARGFDALAAAGGYVAKKKRPPPPKGTGNVVDANANANVTSSTCSSTTAVVGGSRKRIEAPDEDVGAGVGLPAASRGAAT